jgi:two-component system, NtrC family, sensor kinase
MTKRKLIILIPFCLAIFTRMQAQNFGLLQADSLQQELLRAKDDTSRILLMTYLAEAYRGARPDSAIGFAQQALQSAQKLKYPRGEALGLLSVSIVFRELGNLAKAMDYGLKALRIAEQNHLIREQAFALIRIANVHVASRNYREALNLFAKADNKLSGTTEYFLMGASFSLAGDVYEKLDMLDSALMKQDLAIKAGEKEGINFLFGNVLRVYGNVYTKRGNQEQALKYFHQAIADAVWRKDLRGISTTFSDLAKCQRKFGHSDSAIFYAKKGLENAQTLAYKNQEMNAALLLSDLYQSTDPKEALRYLKIADAAKDSLYSAEKVQALQTLSFEEQQQKQEAEAARAAYQNRVKQYTLLGGLAVFLLIMVLLFRNNRRKQAANKLLETQKIEIQNTLIELKNTQAQLVHSEKMASLGELTAGIAHEIQNPLNFVNNFSEVNSELLDELETEAGRGNLEEIRSIVKNLRENEEKITHHGKRADAIVKGMLQHSRTSNGQKELTDINALADEYLRLAYHGLRAKDKSFNAKFETSFDRSIDKINIIPQDLGRVVLNLINNAFYAVSEKQKQNEKGFEPTVSVSTKKLNGKVEVKVKDNGNGIPQKLLDKIFQPFFTTKPTGEGTGLGLSMSYDIITKGHGGELRVVTSEGKGSEFIILLPNNKL